MRQNAVESLPSKTPGITYIFKKEDGWCGLPPVKECTTNPAATPGYTCADDRVEERCNEVSTNKPWVRDGCCMYAKDSDKHFSWACGEGYNGRAAIKHTVDHKYWGYAPNYYDEYLSLQACNLSEYRP